MPTSKAQKLRKAYEFKLGKKLTSKLSDEQISLLSKFYNSLSEAEQRKIDSKIFKGETNDLFDMAKTMSEENTGTYKTKSVKIKSTKISPAKLFGEDKYQKYISELVSQGTIEGRELTPTERKEGFKKRNNKVSFEKFVEKIVTTKATKAAAKVKPPIAVGSTFLGGPIVKSPSSAIQKFVGNKDTQTKTGEDISSILSSIDSILETLRKQQKIEKLTDQYQRRKSEQEKRKLAENKLEKRFKNLKKAAEKIIAPVKGILDKIINFFTQILLGRVVYKLIEWMGDPKNASKIKSIIRFLGDNWPKLLSLYLIFGTSLGKFVRGLVKIAVRGTAKLIAVAAKLASKVIGGKLGGKLGNFGRFLGGRKGKLLTAGLEAAVTIGGTVALTKGLEGGLGEEQNTKPQKFSGGGQVKLKLPTFSGGGFNFKGMLGGSPFGSMSGPVGGTENMQSGYVSGEKGVDKVPAMLSDGEFVMSRGAVQKYGVDTLESMNAAGGGTNKPKIMSGTTYAAGGGLIGDARKGLIDVYNWFNSQGVNLQDPDTWSGTGGKFATGFANTFQSGVNQFKNFGVNQFNNANNYFTSGKLEKDITKLMQSGTQLGAGLYDTGLKSGTGLYDTAMKFGAGVFNNVKDIDLNKVAKNLNEGKNKIVDSAYKGVFGGLIKSEESRYVTPEKYASLSEKEKLDVLVKDPNKKGSTETALTLRNQKRLEKQSEFVRGIYDPERDKGMMGYLKKQYQEVMRGGILPDIGPLGQAATGFYDPIVSKLTGGKIKKVSSMASAVQMTLKGLLGPLGSSVRVDASPIVEYNKSLMDFAIKNKLMDSKGNYLVGKQSWSKMLGDDAYVMTKDPETGKMVRGEHLYDKMQRESAGSGAAAKIANFGLGQFSFKVGKDGKAIINDTWDSNNTAAYYFNESQEALKRGDVYNALFKGFSGVLRVNQNTALGLGNRGFANVTPAGIDIKSRSLFKNALNSSPKQTTPTQIAKTPPKQASVKPSTQSKPKVTVISKPKYQGKGARRSSASKTPNFSAGSKSRTKINILGISI